MAYGAEHRFPAQGKRPARSRLGALVGVAAVAMIAPSVLAAAGAKTDAAPAAPPAGGGVPSRAAAPPAAPIRYRLPREAIWVSNSDQLRRVLAQHRSRDVVLRDGVYDGSGPFYNPRGDRLYAQTLGGAVLRVGLSIGGRTGPGGALVQGILFDVADEAKTLGQSIIHVWGTGTNTRILDVALEGHDSVGAGVTAREVNGLVIRRIVARHFRSYGVIVENNDPGRPVQRPPLVVDIDASFVGWAPPRSSNGTAEACIWIGTTAVVRRVRVHDCAWEGIWVGTAATNALFEDVRVTNDGIGLYLEHFVRSSTFRRLQIGPGVKRGLTCEWADPGWGSQPACVGVVVENSSFDTESVGVYLDQGTVGTTVKSTTFANQCWAAIGDFRGENNLYDTNGNDYSRLGAGAVPISGDHYTAASTCAALAGG